MKRTINSLQALRTFYSKTLLKMRNKNMQKYEFSYQNESDELQITANPTFIPNRSAPEKDFYFYSYHITINNISNTTYQLLRRKWYIRNGNGNTQEVEGPGIVGKTPTLEPGESFEYTSFCHLPTPSGSMRGYYLFENSDEGTKHNIEIPLFFLRTPESFLAQQANQSQQPNQTSI